MRCVASLERRDINASLWRNDDLRKLGNNNVWHTSEPTTEQRD